MAITPEAAEAICGYLSHQEGFRRKWYKRWAFLAVGDELSLNIKESQDSDKILSEIPIKKISCVAMAPESEQGSEGGRFLVQCAGQKHLFAADSETESQQWVAQLEALVQIVAATESPLQNVAAETDPEHAVEDPLSSFTEVGRAGLPLPVPPNLPSESSPEPTTLGDSPVRLAESDLEGTPSVADEQWNEVVALGGIAKQYAYNAQRELRCLRAEVKSLLEAGAGQPAASSVSPEARKQDLAAAQQREQSLIRKLHAVEIVVASAEAADLPSALDALSQAAEGELDYRILCILGKMQEAVDAADARADREEALTASLRASLASAEEALETEQKKFLEAQEVAAEKLEQVSLAKTANQQIIVHLQEEAGDMKRQMEELKGKLAAALEGDAANKTSLETAESLQKAAEEALQEAKGTSEEATSSLAQAAAEKDAAEARAAELEDTVTSLQE
eukprot:gene27891-34460_t